MLLQLREIFQCKKITKMKNLKIITFLGIIHFLSFNEALSQEKINIIGRIVDSENNPIEFANVILLQKSDSSFITGTTTDSLGNFSLSSNINNKLLNIIYLGYETKFLNIEN